MRVLLLFTFVICSNVIFAQSLNNKQPKSSIKWKQINKNTYRFIYPEEYEKQAVLLAKQYGEIKDRSYQNLQVKTRKIDIVLQSDNITANGFVQLAPRKSEFYPIPNSKASNIQWLSQLAIHEIRHVGQHDKMTSILRKPFFELLANGLFSAQGPAWFLEGDAVAIETTQSRGGRGRMPSFFLSMRTNELSGVSYTFDKNILGSFKNITPSYYTTGYLMNTYLRNKYGKQIQNDLLDDMRKRLFLPFGFYTALSRNTNTTPQKLNSRRLYKATMDTIQAEWNKQATGKVLYATFSTTKDKYYANYVLPQTSQNKIFALRTKPDNIPQIVAITSHSTEPIVYTGYQIMPYFQVNKQLIIWDEFRRNSRFSNSTFNVINLYNIDTKTIKTFSFDDRVYTPTLSKDNLLFAAVSVDEAGQSSLIVCETKTGKILQKIELPLELHIQQPQFDDEQLHIVTIGVSQKGTNLIEFDLKNSSYKFLLNWNDQQLERPIYKGENIVYKAHYNGIDNIYEFNATSKSIAALTDSRYGAFNPTLLSGGDSLLFNDYHPDGLKIARIPYKPSTRIEEENIVQTNYDNLSQQIVMDTLTTNENEIISPTKYNPLSGLFNFHSLIVGTSNVDNITGIKPGIYWRANDLLNTSQVTLGLEYDEKKNQTNYLAEIQYSRYRPKFSLKYRNNGHIGQIGTSDDSELSSFRWREHAFNVTMQLPFSIFRRAYIYNFGASLSTGYNYRYTISQQVLNFKQHLAFPLNYSVYFSRNRSFANMDIAPKWGQNITLLYRHSPFDTNIGGHIFSAISGFYFPGFYTNHSFQIGANIQFKKGIFDYYNDIPEVNAFGFFDSPKLNNTLLTTYRFPLFYPDWTIAPIVYIKRFKAELFADYQNLESSSLAPKTFGLATFVDFNPLRYSVGLSFGIRFNYINDSSANNKVVPTFSFGYSM